MTTLRFVTTNQDKLRFARQRDRATHTTIEQAEQELLEPQSLDPRTVAMAKAEQARGRVEPPFIVDDTGYAIEALDGFPGALLKDTLDSIGIEGLLRLMEGADDRDAAYVSTAVLVDTDGEAHAFTYHDTGTVARRPGPPDRLDWGAVMRLHVPDGYETPLSSMDAATFQQYTDGLDGEDHISQALAHLHEE